MYLSYLFFIASKCSCTNKEIILWEWSENQGESWRPYHEQISEYLEKHCVGETIYFGVGFDVYLVNFRNMTCEKQNSTKAYILRKVKSVYKHVKDNSGAASVGNLPFNVHACGFSSMIYNSQNTPSQMSVNNDPFQLNSSLPNQIYNGTDAQTSFSMTLPLVSQLNDQSRQQANTALMNSGSNMNLSNSGVPPILPHSLHSSTDHKLPDNTQAVPSNGSQSQNVSSSNDQGNSKTGATVQACSPAAVQNGTKTTKSGKKKIARYQKI